MFNNTHLPQSEVHGAQADSPAEDPRDASVLAPRFSRLALCVTAASALTLGVVGTLAYGVWFEHDQQAYADAIAGARQSLGMPAAGGLPVDQVVSAQAEMSPVLANTSATGAAHASPDSSDQSQQSQQLENGRNQAAVWSGQVARAPAAAITPAGLGDARLTPPAASTASASTAPSLHSTRRATGSSDSSEPQSATSRTVKETRTGQQERRAPAVNAQQSAQQSARQSAKQNARHQSTLFARMGLFFRRVSYRQHGGANPQQQDIYSHP